MMWTGTPYDRWQKRLGVTLFLSPMFLAAFVAVTGITVSNAFFEMLFLVWVVIFCAMVGLLALKKLYFFWGRRTGRLPSAPPTEEEIEFIRAYFESRDHRVNPGRRLDDVDYS